MCTFQTRLPQPATPHLRKSGSGIQAALWIEPVSIMVSHAEGTLKEFCKAGIWLHEGRAYWFDSINDALTEYKKSLHR